MTLSLTYEPGHTGLQARARVVEDLRPLAERVLELPPLDDHYAPASRAALHHLERWLFASAPDGSGPSSFVGQSIPRCHLPKQAVAYPCSRSIDGTVSLPGSMSGGLYPPSTPRFSELRQQ